MNCNCKNTAHDPVCQLSKTVSLPPRVEGRGDGPYSGGMTREQWGDFLRREYGLTGKAVDLVACQLMYREKKAFHAGAKEQREKDAEIARSWYEIGPSDIPGTVAHFVKHGIARAIQQGGKQ